MRRKRQEVDWSGWSPRIRPQGSEQATEEETADPTSTAEDDPADVAGAEAAPAEAEVPEPDPEAAPAEAEVPEPEPAANVEEPVDPDPLDALQSLAVEQAEEVDAEEPTAQEAEATPTFDQPAHPVRERGQACPACGGPCPARARYCWRCGTALTQPPDPPPSLPGDPLPSEDLDPSQRFPREDPSSQPASLALGDVPFVEREPELRSMQRAFDRVVSSRRGDVVVITGEAGIGKSRLVSEFLERLGDGVTVVRVQCRSADDGGATWPLAEMIGSLLGIDDAASVDETDVLLRQAFGGEPDGDRLISRISHVLGLEDHSGSPEESRWAFRRSLEMAARDRPLVLWLEDEHLADPSLWRLATACALRSREAPILLVATTARQPVGSAGRTIPLEPLGEAGSVAILEALLAANPVDPERIATLARRCRGNPLFIEQTVALLVDRGDLRIAQGPWGGARDPSASSEQEDPRQLTEARLASLPLEERAVLGLVAVFGDLFPWSAAPELLPGGARETVREHMRSLISRRLLVSESGGEILRFCHPLIREITLATVPREARAEVHRRAARWLDHAAELCPARRAELVGSHLASATSLDPTAAGSEDLARRAVDLLSEAASRADSNGDAAGAASLLTRAAALLPPADPFRTVLLLRRAEAHEAAGDLRSADLAAADAIRLARLSGDRSIEWLGRLLRARVAVTSRERDADAKARDLSERAIAYFGVLADPWGLAWAWKLGELGHRPTGYAAASAAIAERIAGHSRSAGRRKEEIAALRALARAVEEGPGPLDEIIERCQEIRARLEGERPSEQEVVSILALLLARSGRTDEARELISTSVQTLEELGADTELASCLERAGTIHALAGNLEGAERAQRGALEAAERARDGVLTARMTANLAHTACDRGRADEAIAASERALALAERFESARVDDPATRVTSRTARARAFAMLGRIAEADRLARQAVRIAEQTDFPELRAAALLDLAEVVKLAGRSNEAAPIARRSLRVSERRGSKPGVIAARALLDSMSGASPGADAPQDDRAAEPRAASPSPDGSDEQERPEGTAPLAEAEG
jgi:tetratricopeptide (TPR) repeat protein